MYNRLSLQGKVAIITGAGGGLGAACARLMAARGARLVLADIAFDRVRALATELRRSGHPAKAIKVDLAREASVRRLIEATVQAYGQLDILHNNAADLSADLGQRDLGIADMASDVWDRTFQVNVRGTMIACREALPHMLAQGSGVIVNTVSNLALQGHIVQAAYSASKAALIQMTRSLAAAYGPQGVRANALAPGLTLTPVVADAFPASVRRLVEKETLRRGLGEPDDLAEAAAWLASDAAANMNGQLIVCDGGLSTHVPDIDSYRQLGMRSAPH